MTPSQEARETLLEKLVLDFGQAAFDCGDYQGDNTNGYRTLCDRREAAYKALMAYVDADRKARQQEAQALARLWPLFERATKDLVFTADRAGEVAADMNTLRAAIAKGERHE